jgi:hypothetical protein
MRIEKKEAEKKRVEAKKIETITKVTKNEKTVICNTIFSV